MCLLRVILFRAGTEARPYESRANAAMASPKCGAAATVFSWRFSRAVAAGFIRPTAPQGRPLPQHLSLVESASALPLGREELIHELAWPQDPDALPTVVIEKVFVTRDNDADSGRTGASQELVVVRVCGDR